MELAHSPTDGLTSLKEVVPLSNSSGAHLPGAGCREKKRWRRAVAYYSDTDGWVSAALSTEGPARRKDVRHPYAPVSLGHMLGSHQVFLPSIHKGNLRTYQLWN